MFIINNSKVAQSDTLIFADTCIFSTLVLIQYFLIVINETELTVVIPGMSKWEGQSSYSHYTD